MSECEHHYCLGGNPYRCCKCDQERTPEERSASTRAFMEDATPKERMCEKAHNRTSDTIQDYRDRQQKERELLNGIIREGETPLDAIRRVVEENKRYESAEENHICCCCGECE